jgi:tape measure domain-containing protein
MFAGRGAPPSAPPGGGGMGPSSQLGAGYFAVGKGLKNIESAYGQAKKFLDTKNLPVTGAIADLGSEFGNAIKQVLLFGTAYKALAFLTSLPGEAFEAAKGLATYKNQLQAVTAESGTFEQSFAFVDGLAMRFNVPLDSARQGFVKLYASMQPAGFDQGQVENLFTGISKAAAAFGLSSDKVDRVNYAFAQMASKGQIMSEELKGQLGDVLPGALGLFAKGSVYNIKYDKLSCANLTISNHSNSFLSIKFKQADLNQLF